MHGNFIDRDTILLLVEEESIVKKIEERVKLKEMIEMYLVKKRST